MFTNVFECSLDVHRWFWMFSTCSLDVLRMFSGCFHDFHRMFSQCSQDVFMISLGYSDGSGGSDGPSW